jgi:hypothetical protein
MKNLVSALVLITCTTVLFAQAPDTLWTPRERSAQNHHSIGHPLDQGNDGCPATLITMMPFYDNGSTVGLSNDFPSPCGGTNAPDVIYEYTPEETAMHTVTLLGSHYDTVLDIREGGACPGDLEVACNDDFFQFQSSLDVQLLAGHTYYIVVDGFATYAGHYRLMVTPWPYCDTEWWWYDSVEVSEYPVDSLFYQHDPTGGCSVDPPSLQEMPWWINQWSYPYGLIGRSFNYYDDTGLLRADEDWYSFTVSEPETVTATVKAEFPVHLEMLRLIDECDSTNLIAQTTQTGCSLGTLLCPCLSSGAYCLRVVCAADTEVFMPQLYRLTLRRSHDACPCDSVENVTALLGPDHQHVWLHWDADRSGEEFWIYGTEDMIAPFSPDTLWHREAIHTAIAPGLQSWTDPDTVAMYQRYVVLRHCE